MTHSSNSRDGLSSRRILVTGGAGFLGSAVVRDLCHAGAEVTVLDNFSSGKREYLENVTQTNGLKILGGDICDQGIVEKSMRNAELVIHLVALPFIPDSYHHPKDFFRTKVESAHIRLNTSDGVGLHPRLGPRLGEQFRRVVMLRLQSPGEPRALSNL